MLHLRGKHYGAKSGAGYHCSSAMRMGFFVKAGHPLQNGNAPVEPADMARFPRMTGRSPDTLDPDFRTMFEGLAPTLECDNFNILNQLTLNTDGILYASDRIIRDELQAGRLIELPMQIKPGHLEIDIILAHLKNRTLSPATRQVISAATSILRLDQDGK